MVFRVYLIFLVLPLMIAAQTVPNPNPPRTFNEISTSIRLIVEDARRELDPIIAHSKIVSNSTDLANLLLQQTNCEKVTVDELRKKNPLELLGVVGDAVGQIIQEGGPELILFLSIVSGIFNPSPEEESEE